MPRYVTLVAVGDNTSRKRDLLQRLTHGDSERSEFLPDRFEDHIQDIVINGKPYLIRIMDTECDEDFKILRWNAYEKATCVILFFSVNVRDSFVNVSTKWCLDVRRRVSHVPIVLVGTITDPKAASREVTKEEGEDLRLLIGAFAYVECTLEDMEGADNVFIEAIRGICYKWNKPPKSFEFLHIAYKET